MLLLLFFLMQSNFLSLNCFSFLVKIISMNSIIIRILLQIFHLLSIVVLVVLCPHTDASSRRAKTAFPEKVSSIRIAAISDDAIVVAKIMTNLIITLSVLKKQI